MINVTKYPFTRVALFIGFAVTGFILLSSCAKKANFLNSTVVPAAKGTVKIKKDKNKNYVIKVQIVNLAEPSRLQPPKANYVVWMVSDNLNPKNIGQIKSSSNFMSSKLTAYFETVSSVKPTKIFITAEDDANIQYSLSQIILTTNNF